MALAQQGMGAAANPRPSVLPVMKTRAIGISYLAGYMLSLPAPLPRHDAARSFRLRGFRSRSAEASSLPPVVLHPRHDSRQCSAHWPRRRRRAEFIN